MWHAFSSEVISKKYVEAPSQDTSGNTVRAILDEVFAEHPRLRHYVLDDQGQLRQHVRIFIDGRLIVDREQLSDAVEESSEVSILQALSGG